MHKLKLNNQRYKVSMKQTAEPATNLFTPVLIANEIVNREGAQPLWETSMKYQPPRAIRWFHCVKNNRKDCSESV